jgi:hypothetical protein
VRREVRPGVSHRDFPLRGSDFCSDMGEISNEVLDWAPW